MKFGEKLKELRLRKDYSLYDVGEKVDVSHSYIDLIEKGKRRASKKVMERLLLVFPEHEEELTDLYMAEKIPENYLKKLQEIKNNTKLEKINTKIIKLPVYGLASAGNGVLVPEEMGEREFLVKENLHINQNCFVVIVHGDSMEPLFYDCDSVLVDPNDCTELRQLANKVVAVEVNGETLVKKLTINNDFEIELNSLNDYYPPIKLKEEDETQCIGVVSRLIDRDLNKIKI
ncbi:XRE family transcriptional regulator [Sebaldella sp. S0638]|uniref:XRE family transcriptional regulator n=1 Tax=Sebaldella sp. S0638 TaxID=2957809 RepID=UPI0020A0A906|nr:XRE family transcriptional regulator [Sebaldella sp. S0638]MCP1226713.1 XRE family transcriptional regulator [Sebaldella sp. S0638]